MQARLNVTLNREWVQRYRNVFGTGEGKQVLAHMLYELGLIDPDLSTLPEVTALKGYAARLVEIISGGVTPSLKVLEGLVTRAMAEPLLKDKEE